MIINMGATKSIFMRFTIKLNKFIIILMKWLSAPDLPGGIFWLMISYT